MTEDNTSPSDADDQIIDLNALDPKPIFVKIGDPPEKVKINPPSTIELMRLGAYAKKMGDADKMTETQILEAFEQIDQQIKKCAPNLKKFSLTITQTMKLAEIITKHGMPSDLDQLKKRNITPDTPKKAQQD